MTPERERGANVAPSHAHTSYKEGLEGAPCPADPCSGLQAIRARLTYIHNITFVLWTPAATSRGHFDPGLGYLRKKNPSF